MYVLGDVLFLPLELLFFPRELYVKSKFQLWRLELDRDRRLVAKAREGGKTAPPEVACTAQ